ncbi:Atu2307/SP_0267 family LLM class monooxygenase [Mangrovicella endophytica]|uniref:Atu2307/SP_0267 family LLM class monooxygenase n=1 Tax=Mangrovicella endophytica TaxID=2066697 RepID=UPI000C9E258C|nr:Atu2307/SP_0267 family LLM class monooxygenase [Mangrovicella endophytica]
MQLGLYTFADNMPDPETGRPLAPAVRFRNLLEEIVIADEVGLDVFGLGEHHRNDYLVSAPAVALAAAAARTKRIRLTSAVTVLSSEDPIRVFEDFSTLDLISEGRAEIMVGRGSFIESFPLFGYDLADYDTLFDEKLGLLLELRRGEHLTWPGGHHTSRISGRGVYPRPLQEPLPLWIAVGGTPQSVVRAGRLGLPLALAIIGGEPRRFAALVDLYRRAAEDAGHDPATLPVSINSHGLIGDDFTATADLGFTSHRIGVERIARERGWSPATRAQFDRSITLQGSDFVGDPQRIIDKILLQHEWFRHDRFLLQMSVGPVPHAAMLRGIELYGTVVAPAVRKALGVPGPAEASGIKAAASPAG